MKYRQSFGKWGENLAAQFLLSHGCQIIERNIRTPYGEIDLLARQEGTLIFVEVKTRSNDRFGFPEDSISAQKRVHMIHSAEAYLQSHPEIQEDWRFDVIAIRGKPGENEPEVKWFENALADN